jgi:hypothetical protein
LGKISTLNAAMDYNWKKMFWKKQHKNKSTAAAGRMREIEKIQSHRELNPRPFCLSIAPQQTTLLCAQIERNKIGQNMIL